MTIKNSLMLSGLLLWAANGGAEEIRPQGVSPGAGGPVSLIESRCPTFSWSLVPGARAYELALFEVNPELLGGEMSDVEAGEPRFRMRLPEMAVSWTPSVGQCLERGGQYAWFIRALGDEWSEWSEAKVFEVASGPSITELEEALRVLRRFTETRQEALRGHKAPEERDRPREQSARRRGVAEPEGSRDPLSSPRASASRERRVRSKEEMNDGPGNRLSQANQTEPVWSPSLEPVAAHAAAPTLGAPSLTLDGDVSLAGTSNVFKDGAVFLWDDTAGNTALGRDALSSNTSGTRNTVVGAGALSADTTGSRNTASGYKSLRFNTHGSDNTATGDLALADNTTGFRNTATGTYALRFNSTGSDNTASGFLALAYNTTGSGNTAMGREALYSNTTADGNTAFGAYALRSNTTGYDNTATGVHALRYNTTGYGNTASGVWALYSNTTGYGNNASSNGALFSNTTGHNNTATGYWALADNTIGFYNSAHGAWALFNNTTGWRNTAVGSNALGDNTLGYRNTAAGDNALSHNTSGRYNTATGASALQYNTSGVYNTALGSRALRSNSIGNRNVALGFGAGSNATIGHDNIFINNVGASTDNAVIKIGTQGTQSKTFVAGIRGTTTDVANAIPVVVDSNGQLGTVSSSGRFKKDIRDMAAASDRLLELRPVTFHYRRHGGSDEGRLQYGLIAEEVAEVFPELVVSSPDGQPETVLYHLMTAMLVNELQKQHERVEAQEGVLAAQRRELERLRARMARLELAAVGHSPRRSGRQEAQPRPPDISRR